MVNAFYRDKGVKVYDGILGDLVEEGTNRKYYIKRENTQPIQLESPKFYNSTDTGLINRVDPFETSQYEDEPFVYKKPKMEDNGMENITKPNSQRESITLKDAVEYSGFSKPYVYSLAKDGKIECSSRKNPLLIYKDSLEEFMKSKGAKPKLPKVMPTSPEETKQLSVPEQQPISEQPTPEVVSVETTSENICVPIDKSPKLNPVEIDYSIVDHNTIVTAEEAARFLGISPNCTWYIKHHLTDDLSLRFFYVFDTRPELVKKWVLKSHINKVYTVVDPALVPDLISLAKNTEEILGRNDLDGNYIKLNLMAVRELLPQTIIKEENSNEFN